jgi:hypothetical protein
VRFTPSSHRPPWTPLYPILDVDLQDRLLDNQGKMTEHGFLAAMLALSILEVAILGLVLGYFTYRILRNSERIEGITAATYLEVKKFLGQLQ